MKKGNRKAAVVAGGVGIVLAGWLGASVYAGYAAEREIRSLVARLSAESGLRVSDLQHERGLLAANGAFRLEVVNPCAGDGRGEAPALDVEYRIANLLLPSAPLRVQWQARPVGALAVTLAEQGAPDLPLQGDGEVSLGGDVRLAMALPELAFTHAGRQISLAPSQGSVTIGQTALAVKWHSDRLSARGAGEALELGAIALDVDLADRHLGTGNTSLSIGRIATAYGSAEGFRHSARVTEEGERMHAQVSETLREGRFADQTLRNVSFALALQNLDRHSVETLGRVAGSTCAMQQMTADEAQRFRQALRTLLMRGFSVGIPKVAGTLGDGTLNGTLRLETRAAPSAGGPIALASLFRADGELRLSGGVPAEVAGSALVAQPDGSLQGRFDYADGVLRANGRVVDTAAIKAGLTEADRLLNALLEPPALAANLPVPEHALAPIAADGRPEAGLTRVAITTPLPEPMAEAPAVLTMPLRALMPRAAAGAQCDGTRECLARMLTAAAREDVGAVFALAARIDELGKPAPRDAAVADKLKAEGQAALAAKDSVLAAELFRRSLAENPRDVDVAAKLGHALVRAGRWQEAVEVLTAALQLDPRRSATWTPLAEALALAGRPEAGQAALWVAYQWSGNRAKSRAFYADQARAGEPALASLYGTVLAWVADGRRPHLAPTSAG